MELPAASVLALSLLGATAENAEVSIRVHIGSVGAGVNPAIGDHHRGW